MKQLILYSTLSILFISSIFAQSSIDSVLISIEKNNTTLRAMRKQVEAEKIGNKTDIFLQNPEVEFNYLWGNPSVIGNRTDFSINQSFDFPSAYSFKNQISDLKNEQSALEYQKKAKEILLQTRLVCTDLTYNNARMAELSKRLTHAQIIATAYKSKFDAGDTNILEYNKAQINLLNTQKELESVKIEKEALLGELTQLNGGIFIDFHDADFPVTAIPADFEDWYQLAEQNNPILGWLKQEIAISQTKAKLMRAQSYPKFQAGYMSEKVVGQQFQGITLGLSIPLWENKNRVRYAQANADAIAIIADDNKLQFYSHLKTLHTKAVGLQQIITGYRTGLNSHNNLVLLEIALDKGEISLLNYLTELSIYYESVNKLLELERDMNRAVAELKQYI